MSCHRIYTKRMKVSAFVAASVDGFIARADGRLDWLEGGDSDYGYQSYFDSVDALIIGRKTFVAALAMATWPYGFKRVLVLSRRYVEIPQNLVRFVESTQYPPSTLVESLRQARIAHLAVDGGLTIQSFIQSNLLNEITITQIPILLGGGVPLFGPLPAGRSLTLQHSQSFDGGVQQSRYQLSN